MVLDATISLTVYPADDANNEAKKKTEALCPERHKISLPLNLLNSLFSSCEVAFNHHTKLDCDR